MPQVTIPELNNINRQAGSLVLTIDDASNKTANLLKTGPFLLKKDALGFSLSTDAVNIGKQMRVNAPVTGNTTLIWSWIKNNHRLIALNNDTGQISTAIKESSAMTEDFGLIDLVNPIVGVDGKSEQNAGSGKNTFNVSLDSWVSNTTLNNTTGEAVYSPDRLVSLNYIPIKENIDYYISALSKSLVYHRFTFAFYDKQKIFISYISPVTNTVGSNKGGVKFTTPINTAFIRVGLYYLEIDGIQLEEGTTATPYEPPAPSPEYPIAINSLDKSFDIVSSVGKENLAKKTNVSWSRATSVSNEVLYYQSINGNNPYIVWDSRPLLKSGVTYSFSMKWKRPKQSTYGGAIRLIADNTTITYLANTASAIPTGEWEELVYVYTPTSDTLFGVQLYMNQGTPLTEVWVKDLKIEKGEKSLYSQAPEDIQYNTQSSTLYKTNILLSEPLRSVGDVKDRLFLDTDSLWKVERNVGEFIADGSENWTNRDSEGIFPNIETRWFQYVVPNMEVVPAIGRATHFAKITSGYLDEIHVRIANISSQLYIGVFPPKTMVETLAEYKKWLSEQKTKGSPITIQYQLVTPSVETLSAEQQTKLNNFYNNTNGAYLYATGKTLTSYTEDPFFRGHYQQLSTYAQDVLYDASTTALISKLNASGTVLFDADYTKPMHYAKKPYLEATMAPRDNSPILVNNEEGPMQRQYFFDHITGLYAETNTESFVYRGENELAVSYDKLDPTYSVTVRCGAESIGEPVTVIDNRILLTMTPEQKEYWYGKTFDVTYRLASSYTVEYNEEAAHDSYLVRLENHQDQEVTITQEGNRFSSQRLMKEIELNPIVNPQHTGFMYISKEEQVSQAFRLTLSSNYIIANGLDSADFIVEVIDQDGNEVLSPYVDVFIMNELGLVTSQFGSFTPIINKDTLKAKNAAGRSYYKYQAPLIRKGDTKKTQKVFAVAYDRKHKIGAQVPLILRPSEPVYDVTGTNYLKINLPLQTRSDASIVFEYFARYYEKPIPVGHPVLLLDSDGDGVLTYTDLNQFLIEQTNAVRMQEIAYALRETEAF